MSGTLGYLHIHLALEQAKFQSNLEKAQRKAKQFSERTTQYFNNIEQAAKNLNRNSNIAISAGIGRYLGSGAQAFIRQADVYTNIGNKLRLVEEQGINSSRALQSVFDISLKTAQSVDATSSVYQRFAQNAQQLGISQSQVASLTETVSKAVAISGASAAAAQAALMQFGQSLASGVFRGQEFNSVMEQTPGLAQAIARGLGVTTGELRQMANDGKLTGDILVKALEKAKSSVDTQFSTRILTVSSALENLNTSATKWIGEANNTIGVTSGLAKSIDFLAKNFDFLATSAVATASTFALIKFGPKAKEAFDKAQAVSELAQKTIWLTKAEQAQIATELKATQTYIASLQAKINLARTEELRIALSAEMQAQTLRETALIEAQVAATTKLATARRSAGVLGKALAFLGGPWGALALAASIAGSAMYEWYQKAEQAKKEALEFANNLDLTTEALKKMDRVALQATAAKVAQGIDEQKNKVLKLTKEYENLNLELEKAKEQHGKVVQTGYQGYQKVIDNTARIVELERKSIIKKQELIEQQLKLNSANQTAEDIQTELNNKQDLYNQQLTQLIDSTVIAIKEIKEFGEESKNTVGQIAKLTGAVTGLFVEFQKLNGISIDLDTTPKLSEGAKKLIEQSKRRSEITREKDPYKKSKLQAQDYVLNLGDHYSDEDKKAILAQKEKEFLSQNLAQTQSKGERTRQNWLNFYDELRQKSSSALGEIVLEQGRMFQRLEEYNKKGVISHQEYESARLAITQRFNKQRLELASQYAPEVGLKAKLEEDIAVIRELQQANELTLQQAQRAVNAVTLNYAQGMAQNAVDPLAKLRGQFDPNQDLANKQAEEIALINAFYANKEGLEEEHQARIQEIKDRYKNDQFQKEMSTYAAGLNDLGGAFGNLASMVEQSAGKQSSAYKAMFAVSKAFAIAEATVKLSQAIAQAMADPTSLTPAQKFANMAAVAAAGVNVISQISSVGFSSGGYTGDGGKYQPAGIVHKGEYVITKEATARLGLDYLNFLNYGKRGFSSGGGVSVPRLPTSSFQSSTPNVSVKVINNGEPAQANVSTKQKGGQLELTIELVRNIAKQEASEMIQTNFRPGGAFS
ncbi:tape measure protein [Pasteurella multocida]|uniref:tape measure protein n=1 Tax=Pasteurella multocida TaxID=747 RepID=UPI002023FF2D|nr:tape measure protein [Pasteurella multocida]URJ84961.1 tape measure protein [Pasteurella multocida]